MNFRNAVDINKLLSSKKRRDIASRIRDEIRLSNLINKVLDRKADSRYYDVTWGKLENLYGHLPNWRNDIEAYIYIINNELEASPFINLDKFKEVARSLGVKNPNPKIYDEILKMLDVASNKKTVDVPEDMPDIFKYEDFPLEEESKEKIVFHSEKHKGE